MKKWIFTAMAALTLTACTNDEPSGTTAGAGKSPISFNPTAEGVTRGFQNDYNDIKANGFYVVAYGDNAFYWNREKAEYDGSTINDRLPGFYLSKNYYWPSYELTFAAWYPCVLPSGFGTATLRNQQDNEWNAGEGEYVSQPVWADGNITRRHRIVDYVPSTDRSRQVDIMIARTKGRRDNYANNAVNLNFRHIMSQVAVEAMNLGEKTRVVVEGVALRRIPSKGTFEFPDAVTDDRIQTSEGSTANKDKYVPLSCWTMNYDTNQRYECMLDEKVVLTDSEYVSLTPAEEGVPNNFILIPQDFNGHYWGEGPTANGAYLAVKICVSLLQADGTWKQHYPVVTEGGYKEGDCAWAAVGVFADGGRWEPGKRYTYQLNFNDDGVGKKDPEPDSFDPDPSKPGGDDILGRYIWFTCSVDSWVETQETPNM